MGIGRRQKWRQRSGRPWIYTGLVIFILVFLAWLQLNSVDSNEYITMTQAALNTSIVSVSNGSYTNFSSSNISEIIRNIEQCNKQQVVLNEKNFEPFQNDSIVIIVQIHNRINYLRHLIFSLEQAPGISQTLLVFSHDYYDEEINDLVRSIDFCKVMQIFYPYSIQTHPYEFPGEDPGDCDKDMRKDQALSKKCNNALDPDMYGHYREAKFTQLKHHWWWKANRVFNQLEVTRNHTGLVVFLEEDHYVAEDFIHMLRLMERSCKESCNVLNLGTYLKTYHYNTDSDRVEISPWKSNIGMAFNKSTWTQIVECADNFCKYDDYNWDWSLLHVSENCLRQKLLAMVTGAPRVFHIGTCGFHLRKRNCESNTIISEVQQVLKTAKRHLYPDNLITTSPKLKKTIAHKANGGWGDRRDHILCIEMTVE